MNKIVKIVLGVVGVIILAVAAIFYFTGDMVTAADEFFAAVKQQDMDKAYTYLSEEFQAGTSQSDLVAYFEENRLDQFTQASWTSRSINGGRGVLTGSITTESGGVVPLTLSFVKGESGWKIYAIQKPAAGIREASATTPMPSEQEQIQLVAESMRVFADSVNDKSMAKFHSHISNLWQQQFTVAKLDEAFGGFYDIGVDLKVLDHYNPQFDDKSSIDDNGVLAITGHYPTRPNQVYFAQKYIYEGLGWKLVGFSANIQ